MGLIPMKCGEVKRVRVLGVLALIDNGETDWKVITISCDDLLAERIHTLNELECVLPGAVGSCSAKVLKPVSGLLRASLATL